MKRSLCQLPPSPYLRYPCIWSVLSARFTSELGTILCTSRVPRLGVFAVFILLAFPRINNLRVFNATNSSIPTAPTSFLPLR